MRSTLSGLIKLYKDIPSFEIHIFLSVEQLDSSSGLKIIPFNTIPREP